MKFLNRFIITLSSLLIVSLGSAKSETLEDIAVELNDLKESISNLDTPDFIRLDLAKTILVMNPNASFSINAEDINQITWLEGTTPIAAEDILTQQAELIAEYGEAAGAVAAEVVRATQPQQLLSLPSLDLAKTINAMNPNAGWLSINAEDVNQIVWREGVTPISAEAILAKQAELRKTRADQLAAESE